MSDAANPDPTYLAEEVDGSDPSSDDLKKTGKTLREDNNDEYPMRYLTIPVPSCGPLGGGEINLNPFTSFFGFAILWGFAIYCMASPDDALTTLKEWQSNVTEHFTWFYIAANPAFTFFTFWLAIRYGHIKLGKPDEKPEFSDLTYFTMLFSAGIAVGLFFYGVAEPLWHRSDNWFASLQYRGKDEVDQWAMLITMYHYGFAGWSPYLIVAIAAGLASYRYDLPMTVRSTLYILLGPYTWGWIGDVIDGFSIVFTVAGICTSLGLGAMQIITGAGRLGWFDRDSLTEDELTNKYVIVIWSITLVATISVVTGLDVGVKFLSQLGFSLGMVLLIACSAMENTAFLYNLLVQTVGYYFQWGIFQVPFWTDAFGQLEDGEGRAQDGNSAATWWMNGWTVFYMAWWTAWGAFVGLFVARISRGRTIREVVMYVFIAPLMYSFLWFCSFGGIGLRQARQAEELEWLGEQQYNDSTHFQSQADPFCYDVPQTDVWDNDTLVFTNSLPGITPVCKFDSSDSTQAWFNVMYSFSYPDENGFGGFGNFLAGLSLIAVCVYFVTSSDSGSLIVDHLASNGHEEHHWIQRVFWAFTEGAVATALLVAGGQDALSALQAASIVFALPFNLLLFFMMYSIVKMCQTSEQLDKTGTHIHKLPDPHMNSFGMPIFGGVFNIFEFICSLGQVHPDRVEKGMHMPTGYMIKETIIALLLPMVSLWRVYTHLEYPSGWKILLTTTYGVSFAAMVALFGCGAINMGFVALGFVLFFSNACILTNARAHVREKFNLVGNPVADFALSSFLYFQVLAQLLYQCEVGGPPPVELDGDVIPEDVVPSNLPVEVEGEELKA